MGNIKAIILNPDVQESWSDFVESLPDAGYSIKEANRRYYVLLRRWSKKTAKKHCPPGIDYREVQKVLIDHFGA